MLTQQRCQPALLIAEVEQYEANIAMYKSIMATLPKEYPAHLEQYKGAIDKHATSALIDNLDDVELLSKLWYADECYTAIRSETVELQKAKAILEVLKKL